MRAIPTNYVEAGSILGENLYNADGRILIKTDTPLTAQLIKKIETNNIYTVYIKNRHTNIEVNRLLDQPFRVKGILLIKTLFDAASKGNPIFDDIPTHTRDFSRELVGFLFFSLKPCGGRPVQV